MIQCRYCDFTQRCRKMITEHLQSITEVLKMLWMGNSGVHTKQMISQHEITGIRSSVCSTYCRASRANSQKHEPTLVFVILLRCRLKSSFTLRACRQSLVLIVTMGTDSLWPMVTRAKGFDRWSKARVPLSVWGDITICQAEQTKVSKYLKAQTKTYPHFLFSCVKYTIIEIVKHFPDRVGMKQVNKRHYLRGLPSVNQCSLNAKSQFHTLLWPRKTNAGSIVMPGEENSPFQGPEFTQLLQVCLHRDHSVPGTVNSVWRAKRGQTTAARGSEPLHKYWLCVHPSSPHRLEAETQRMRASRLAETEKPDLNAS